MSIKETEVWCVLRTKVCEDCGGEVIADSKIGMSYPPTYFYACKSCGHAFSSSDAPKNLVFIKPDGTLLNLF